MKTVKEVAEIFNVHFRTVHLWIKDGKIKAMQVGRKYLVEDSEIEYVKKNGLRTNVGN